MESYQIHKAGLLMVAFIFFAFSAQAQYSISGPSSTDIGDQESYTANNTSSLLGKNWSVNKSYTVVSGQGTSSANIRINATGNAIVNFSAVTPGTFNSVYLSKNVTVNGTVVGPVTITPNLTERCQGGGTTDFNASASNATSYSWSISNAGSSTINSSTGLVNWSSSFSGTATVSVTANGPNNSSSTALRNVTVTPSINSSSLGLSVSSTVVCSGENETLSVFGASGNSYELLRNNVAIGSGINGSNTTINWSVSSAGDYRIRASKLIGSCPSVLGSVTTLSAVQNVGTFQITGGTSLRCRGTGTSDYNASASNATNYVWSIANAGSSTINSSNGVVSWHGSFSGTATISVTASNSCDSRTVTRNVEVSAPPISSYSLSGTATLCSGMSGSITLSDSQLGVDYELRRGSQPIGTISGTGNGLTWSSSSVVSGTYSVIASNDDGTCSDVTISDQWTIGSTSAGTIGINPSTGSLTNLCPGQVQLFPINTNTIQDWTGVDSWNSTRAIVNLSAGQTKTVTLYATNNCNVSQDITVTLTAKPAPSGASITSGSQQVCQGTPSTDYNATALNFDSDSWQLTPVGAGNINQNGTVSWNPGYAGEAVITYRASNSCNLSDSDTRTVTVSAPPNTTYTLSGTSSVCSGSSGTITLSDSQTGVDYELKRGSQTIATLAGTGNALTWTNSTITAGTYSVIASNGICADQTLTSQWTIGSITSNPIAISSSSGGFTDLCPGQVQLFPVNTASITNWTGVDSWNSTNAVVTIGAGQSITVTLYATDSCNVPQEETITLTGSTGPTGTSIDSGDTQVCQGTSNSDYTGSSNNSDSHTWLISPTQAGTIDQNGTVSWNSTYVGDAIITYEARNSCNQTATADITVDVTNTITFYEDKDKDGNFINTVQSCTNPDPEIYVTADQVTGSRDCDDNDDTVGQPFTWFVDADGDNYPLENSFITSCENPGIATGNPEDYSFGPYAAVDCDDTDPLVSTTRWYRDVDNDGLGDPFDNSLQQCEQPTLGGPWVDNNDDFCQNDDQNTCGNVPISTDFGANYVYSRSYQTSRSGNATNFFTQDDELIQNITYFDDLGRPVQQIALEQSPENNGAKKDLVTQMKYDGFGRMVEEWLPVPLDMGSNFGDPKTDVESSITAYYNTPKYENTGNPFSTKQFDLSPLNRVEKQAAPGNDWAMGSGHEIEFDYETNGVDEVRFFEVDFLTSDTEQPELVLGTDGYYKEGRLFKTITYDENHSGTDKDHSTEEFKDNQGRTLLKRTYENEIAHDTYYVYDDYGNLTYVLPPKMDASTAGLSAIQNVMDDLGYQYVYDYRNRLVEKQIPGKGEEYIVYNKLDQPIMTQDANQRAKGEWLFTKYDAFGRVAYTGIVNNPGTPSTIYSELDASNAPLWVTQGDIPTDFGGATGVYYNANTYPNNGIEILTINYYDNYEPRPSGFPTSITLLGSTTGETETLNVKGLSTISKVKVLEHDDWITTLSYYDKKGRPVYSYSENSYLSTTDIMETQLDFIGKPLKTKTTHIRGANTIVTIDNFNYDHVGRLLSQTQCIGDETMGSSCESTGGTNVQTERTLSGPINSQQIATQSITVTNATLTDGAVLRIDPNAGGTGGNEELIAFNSYDELGQLVGKKVGGAKAATYNGTDGLQTVDYNYNIRGWLKNINEDTVNDNDLFNFTLRYNDPVANGTPLYNGNISQTSWNTQNEDSNVKTYSYAYDALNRLSGAAGQGPMDKFDVSGITYDKNGNIMTLKREGWNVENPLLASNTGFDTMDDLTYVYDNGNRLLTVSDAIVTPSNVKGEFKDDNNATTLDTTQDYSYDANGNMTSDTNKGISTGSNSPAITYNHLNLPVQIIVTGAAVSGTIQYVYDATGVKLKKIAAGTSNGETEYAGNYIYENGSLKQISQPEGYIEPDGNGWQYVYRYSDIWGNTRITYADDNNNGTIETGSQYSEIRREQNYYPFGLEHKGYNGISYGVKNDLKTYQGQEFTEDLGLNTHEWKYRVSDPAIGRFWQVDPLAEDYVYNSTYAFQENKMGMGVELEGLELGNFPIFNPTVLEYVQKGLDLVNEVIDNTKVTVSSGSVIGAKFGKVGGEINLGSQEVGSFTNDGEFTPGDGSTTEGFELAYGIGELSFEENTKTTSQDISIIGNIGNVEISTPGTRETTVTENTGKLTLLGFGPDSKKTTTAHTISNTYGESFSQGQSSSRTTSFGFDRNLVEVSEDLVKSTKLSLAIGIKIEIETTIK